MKAELNYFPFSAVFLFQFLIGSMKANIIQKFVTI